jgi:glycosyltransferase involved in cell wall biosynthesis
MCPTATETNQPSMSASVTVPELDSLFDNVRYVPKRVAHHAQHSGYDALFAALNMRQARSGTFVRLARWIPKGLAWRLWSLRPQPSQQSGLEAELGAAPWIATGRGRLCHFIYGEDTFLFTPLWKRGSNRCLATLHYPPAVLPQRVNPGSLRALDAVIIVGENQRELLSGLVAPDRIHFCPHHVDTDFFCPAGLDTFEPRNLKLVCVGQLYRDYDTLLSVLRLLRTLYKHQVSLDIVGPQEHSKHPLTTEPGVTVHQGIDDEALRALYRNAAVGVLPLTDSTANNSLLEMMACGLAIVTTDVGGVRDYVQSGGVASLPLGDSEGFARAVDALLTDPKRRAVHAASNREHAVREFSFTACARKLATIYRRVLSPGSP